MRIATLREEKGPIEVIITAYVPFFYDGDGDLDDRCVFILSEFDVEVLKVKVYQIIFDIVNTKIICKVPNVIWSYKVKLLSKRVDKPKVIIKSEWVASEQIVFKFVNNALHNSELYSCSRILRIRSEHGAHQTND